MEDEGRHHFCGVFPHKKAAKDYIREEVKTSKGYFRKSSFTIWRPE